MEFLTSGFGKLGENEARWQLTLTFPFPPANEPVKTRHLTRRRDSTWLRAYCSTNCQFNSQHPCQVGCLSYGFIAVKRLHNQGNSYKVQHLVGDGLQVHRSSLLSWQKVWQCPEGHNAEWAENCPSGSETNEKTDSMRVWKPPQMVTHFFQQGHTNHIQRTTPCKPTL